jgi:NAD(P)-dependent dehydrogenase (short-subunit alcohol dehydrogenase family)
MNATGDAKAKSEYVALVTGASRGVGRGVALALADSGPVVYATGRNIAQSDLPNKIVRISCDHRDDAQVRAAFDQIQLERGRLDILVNNAWGGYETLHLHLRRAALPAKKSTTINVAGAFRTASRYAMAAAVPAFPLSMQPQTVKPMKAASATTGTARSS